MKFVDLDAQFRVVEPGIRAALDRVLQHTQFIMGPEVGALERQLGEYCGARHVLTAASGSDALLMALMAYDVGPGDGIIAPPFTFVATAEMVALLGATTVFVDVEENSFNLDVNLLEEAIRKVQDRGRVNLKGIIPVDLFGLPARHDEIQAIAERNGLFVISDAAQSFGAQYRGRKAGVFGDIAITSFFPAKPLGCYGDGGAVFTASDELAEKIESIRIHGKGDSQYENIRIGVTGRMDTIQAAVLGCKLEIFEGELDRRQEIAGYYSERLEGHVAVPAVPDDSRSAWAAYTIRTPRRDQVRAQLQRENIPFAVYYPSPLHRQPAFADALWGGEDMAVSDRLSREVISLPIHPYLADRDQDRVIEGVIRGVG
ncbi:MAG: DegT/DnrJ/EryC1/StrS family aminotransferase [Gammaproteobacteria bacterium]|nr:DegT/DnrJ/EryC1/StrS family aminotransferase [Gammaproteobacteria bacterium]